MFCLVILFTGCRISEALELTKDRIDSKEGKIVFRTLKQRNQKQFRAVPIPTWLIKGLQSIAPDNPTENIWSFSRRTGWRIIKSVMENTGIDGAQNCPKGLRHGFGMACAEENMPAKLIAKLLGHKNEKTTSIYLDAVGREERNFIKRTWIDQKLLLSVDY